MRPPRGWGRRAPAKPAIEVTTDFGGDSTGTPTPAAELKPGRSPSASACEPYREQIELALSRGRDAMAIWQDLVDGHGFSASYQSVKRFLRKLCGSSTPEARVVIQTAPGEETQVDYGSGPMVRDPQSGQYRRTRLFLMTLGYSRKSVRLLVFRSSSRVWAELHEKAFRRLGGATRIVVLDNLREGVLTPDIYDPSLNPLYREVLKHYGAVGMPCRVQDPDRKGKVESGVGHAKRTPLKGLRFESLEEAQAYLDRWEDRWADTRIHGTTKRQVTAMFAEGRPTLLRNPSATTNTAREPYIWTAAWRSKPLTMAHRPAGSAAVFRCSGTRSSCVCSIRIADSCRGNTCVSHEAVIASSMRTAPSEHRRARNIFSSERKEPADTSEPSARLCISFIRS